MTMQKKNYKDNPEWVKFNIAAHISEFWAYKFAHDISAHEAAIYDALVKKWNDKREFAAEDGSWYVPKTIYIYHDQIMDLAKVGNSTISACLPRLEKRGLITNFDGTRGQGRPMSLCITPLPNEIVGDYHSIKSEIYEKRRGTRKKKEAETPEQTAPNEKKESKIKPYEPAKVETKEDRGFDNVELFSSTEIQALAMGLDTVLKQAIQSVRIANANTPYKTAKYYVHKDEANGVFWGYNSVMTIDKLKIIVGLVLNKRNPEELTSCQGEERIERCIKMFEGYSAKWIGYLMESDLPKCNGDIIKFEKMMAKFNPRAIADFPNVQKILKLTG